MDIVEKLEIILDSGEMQDLQVASAVITEAIEEIKRQRILLRDAALENSDLQLEVDRLLLLHESGPWDPNIGRVLSPT